MESDADGLAEKPIRNARVDIVVVICLKTTEFDTLYTGVKNGKGIGRRVPVWLKRNLVKVSIFDSAFASAVELMVTIEFGQGPIKVARKSGGVLEVASWVILRSASIASADREEQDREAEDAAKPE